jgi:hypothetical protein
MRTCRRSLSVLLLVLLFTQLTFAKNDIHDWRNVRTLELGSTIVVKTKQGEKYQGTLDYAGLDSISIVVNVPRVMRQVIKVPRDDVKEVRAKLSRMASSALGGGIGLGVGLGLGQIIDSKDRNGEDPGLGKAVMGFLGLILGAALGRDIGFGKKKVYEAR